MGAANLMEKLPTVISCCFCCYLRAGTIMIGIFSFLIGLMFAPNINHSKGFWEMGSILQDYDNATEEAIQVTLGGLSIMLCCISVLLLVGACCNLPILILVYQWGALVYSGCLVIMFIVLASFCFFVHTNCAIAGGLLVAFIVLDVLLTTYFLLVVNSLRVSLLFLSSSELKAIA